MKLLNSTGIMACLLLSSLSLFGDEATKPGLIANYNDGSQQATGIVSLPELGLAANESPHPAIKPAFDVSYRGLMTIERPDTYTFDYPGSIQINGKVVDKPIELQPGQHELILELKRPKGAVSSGLLWESGHFIKEPVPPTVLSHRSKVTLTPSKGPHPSPAHRIHQTMETMKCAECHDANFLATMHHKFAPDALMPHIRHTNPMKWYGAMTGPKLKESDALKQLVADLRKLPGPTRKHTPSKAQAKGLKMVGTRGGLACIACHDLLDHRTAAESKGPNLAYLDDRVSYDWFVRWMSDPQRHKPGVPMPAFFAAQSPAERKANIDALWDYILKADKMPLPEELRTKPNQFVLKPTNQPMVHRVYLRLPDGRELMRAICVGLPKGISYCFDAETCSLVYVWEGGYLDMTAHWKNKSLHPVGMIGKSVMLLAADEGIRTGNQPPKFRGYELINGLPRFEFSFGDTLVQLTIDSTASGEIQQSLIIAKSSMPVRYTGPAPDSQVSAEASAGKWKGRHLELTGKETNPLIIKLRSKEP